MSPTHFRRASVLIAPLLSAAIVVFLASFSNETHSSRIATLSEAEGWYIPNAEDFRPEYERDRANQKVQTWKEYWGWITSFYNGNIFSPGWSRGARATVDVVESGTKQNGADQARQCAGEDHLEGVGQVRRHSQDLDSRSDAVEWCPHRSAARREWVGRSVKSGSTSGECSGRKKDGASTDAAPRLGQPTWDGHSRGGGPLIHRTACTRSTGVTATTMRVGSREIRTQKDSDVSE